MPVPELLMMDFKTRDEASEAVAELIAAVLIEEIKMRGRASLLVSGGSTPTGMFKCLSEMKLEWPKVNIGLVDDRCVPENHDASNAGLVKRYLLKNEAAEANFVPMIAGGHTALQLAENSNKNYEPLVPARMAVLGMGSDGHTASWFPGASNLQDALRPKGETVVCIDAEGCPVAGEITDRLTLTRPAIAQSNRAIMMMFGDEKREIYLRAMSRPIEQAPVRAVVEDLGDRLITAWAP